MARPQTRWIDRRHNRLRLDPWHLGIADYVIHRIFVCPYRDGTPQHQAYTRGWYYALARGPVRSKPSIPPVWLRRHKDTPAKVAARFNYVDKDKQAQALYIG